VKSPLFYFLAGATAGILLVPEAAQAHLIGARFGDFYSGLLHPLTALEHAVFLLALGLLAGLQEPKVGRWILLATPGGLLLGVALALAIPDLAFVSWINKASFVIVGLLAAAAWRLPAIVLGLLAFFFGVTHGYENGLAVTGDMQRLHFVLGVATAGLIVLALIAAGGVALVARHDWTRIAVRAAGSWVAAVGLITLAL